MPKPKLEETLEKVGGMPSTTRSAAQGIVDSIAKMRGSKVGNVDLGKAIEKGRKWEDEAWRQIKIGLTNETEVYVDGKRIVMNEETAQSLVDFLRKNHRKDVINLLTAAEGENLKGVTKTFEENLTKSLKNQDIIDEAIKAMLTQTPREVKALPPGSLPKAAESAEHYVSRLEKLGKYAAIGIIAIGGLLVGKAIYDAITTRGVEEAKTYPGEGISPEGQKEEKWVLDILGLKKGDIITFSRVRPDGTTETRRAKFVDWVKNDEGTIMGFQVWDEDHGNYLVARPSYTDQVRKMASDKKMGWVVLDEFKLIKKKVSGEPIPAPGMIAEEKPKKVAQQPVKPPVGRVVSKTEIEELEGKTTEELFSMITLQYDVPGKYKGYSYMGGANGLQSGRDVAIVQILANRLFGANLLVNGVYDAETMAAVKALQGRVGVTQDGYFGIDTKTALGEYLKMRAPPKEEEGEEGAPPGEKPVAPTPGEAVLGRFVFTREIDRDYVKPPKGPTQLMDENFYVKTDSGWLTAKELVRKDLNEIDKNWGTDKATAATVASKENWNTRTLTRKNIGVFSWANTKKVLFPYLYASGQMVEFRTWEPLEIKNEEGEVVLRVAAGQVVQGVIREYDEGGKDGSITMEITAVLDDFTVNGGKPIKPSGEETKPSPAVAATPTVAEGEEGEVVSELPPPAAERDYS